MNGWWWYVQCGAAGFVGGAVYWVFMRILEHRRKP